MQVHLLPLAQQVRAKTKHRRWARYAKSILPLKPTRDTLGQASREAGLGSGGLALATHFRSKGDHHARSLLGPDGHCHHCRGRYQRRHFGAREPNSAQAPAASGTTLKTLWGEPDLQGIWTDEFDTPLQRAPEYVNEEFFTQAQREEIDKQRRAHFGSDPRQERGTAIDVGGAYNTVFLTVKHVGARTSLIINPPNGRIPPQTPEAQQAAAADREFRLALLQSTDACKNKAPACAGG
jgi:hypothetical protein